MKKILLLATMMVLGFVLRAQSDTDIDTAKYKIIIQLTSADTNVHKMLVKQLGNILSAAPNSKVEVVCHGPGIDFLTTKRSFVYPKIKDLKGKGIEFVVCENTMRERKMTKEEIMPEANYVRAGIIEIVKKQEEGWSYIRATQ